MDTSSLTFLSNELFVGLYSLSENPQTIFLWLIALTIIYLSSKQQNQLIFFLPLGIGIIIANIPFSSAISPNNWLIQLQNLGLKTQFLPLIFLFCAGLKCDFTALLQNPKIIFFTTFSRLSIFIGTIIATTFGFSFTQASAINIIATGDLPTIIFFINTINSDLLGSVVLLYFFYIYFAQTIQKTIINFFTTKKELQIDYTIVKKTTIFNQTTKFLFPILLIIILGTLMPFALSLIGIFMLGTIIKEANVVPDNLEKNFLSITIILLSLTIGSLIKFDDFFKDSTLMIIYSVIILLILHTLINITALKIYNKICKNKLPIALAAYTMPTIGFNQQKQNNQPLHSALQLSNLLIAGLMMALIPAIQKLMGV